MQQDHAVVLFPMKKMADGCPSNNLATAMIANALPDAILDDAKCDQHGGALVVEGALKPYDFLDEMYSLYNTFQMMDNQATFSGVVATLAKGVNNHVGVPPPGSCKQYNQVAR